MSYVLISPYPHIPYPCVPCPRVPMSHTPCPYPTSVPHVHTPVPPCSPSVSFLCSSCRFCFRVPVTHTHTHTHMYTHVTSWLNPPPPHTHMCHKVAAGHGPSHPTCAMTLLGFSPAHACHELLRPQPPLTHTHTCHDPARSQPASRAHRHTHTRVMSWQSLSPSFTRVTSCPGLSTSPMSRVLQPCPVSLSPCYPMFCVPQPLLPCILPCPPARVSPC